MNQDALMTAQMKAVLDRQAFMAFLGIEAESAGADGAVLAVDFREELTQQDGFLHAGLISTLADNAMGGAAVAAAAPGTGVLTIEFKINFLRPAIGSRLKVTGTVIKPGRRISVCEAVAVVIDGADERLVAKAQGTMMMIAPETS